MTPEQNQQLFAELYQILGALCATEKVLDQVLAAAEGKPLPYESLLPFSFPDICENGFGVINDEPQS